MIDIETLGKVPGSAVVSIGAYNLDTEATFYCVIDLASNFACKMSVDASTFEWWLGQSDKAKEIFKAKDKVTLPDALSRLLLWLPPSNDLLIWGNGINFDGVLLEVAFRRCGLEVPWKYTNCRDHRTAVALYPGIKKPKNTSAHNSLADAIAQGQHLKAILNHNKGKTCYT